MTGAENDCLRDLERRIVRLEEKVDAAAEVREMTHQDMAGISNRMSWLLGLVVSLFLLLGPGAGLLAFQVASLGDRLNDFEVRVFKLYEDNGRSLPHDQH